MGRIKSMTETPKRPRDLNEWAKRRLMIARFARGDIDHALHRIFNSRVLKAAEARWRRT
jgi:hypothetical protein